MNNNIKLDIKKPEPLYHMVKKKIVEMVRNGDLKDGDRLPPEEEIAKQNNISRGTVRMALEDLAREGIIKSYPKRGTFISLEKSNIFIKIAILSLTISVGRKETDFYRNELWGGIEEGVVKEGTGITFLNHQKGIEFSKDIDGILFLVPLRSEIEILNKIKRKGIPLIVVGVQIDGFNYVSVDNEKGVEKAISYLVKLGHKKIGGIFSSLDYFDSFYRYKGYLSTLKKFNLPIKKEWIKIVSEMDAEKWIEESEKKTEEILSEKDKPTAIFSAGEFLTLGAKKSIEKKGYKIPSDISLIGFDDFYLAKYLEPPLTVISQPVWEIGKIGVEKLVEIINNRQTQPYQILLQPDLIIRGSTSKVRKEVEKCSREKRMALH